MFLNLAQAKLREQVEELVGKLNGAARRGRSGVQEDRRGAAEGGGRR